MNERQKPQLIAGIHWVRGEVEQSIARARSLIDHFAESGGDPLQLQQAYVELHQVRGTAAMIQCYGLAAVASEMAAGLQDLTQQRIAEPEPLYSALLGGTIQLTDYIQALADGTPDCALVMQPAINELRMARGQPVLTESDIFVAQMQAMGSELPLPDDQTGLAGAAQQQARRLLPVFQSSLLAWIKGGADAQTGAARAGKVAELVAQNASHATVHQLWRVAAGTIEAYLARGVGNALELKRLFGRLGAQLRVLAASGEAEAAAQAGDLSLQLLFLVGRATSSGARVKALREAFELDAYLPDAATLDNLRRRIHGPSTSLFATVANEIRADFSRVKDQIDLIVRAGGSGETAAIADGLMRIAHTLSALGLNRLQQLVMNQSRSVAAAAAEGGAAAWMDLATSILRVENDLEEALFRQMLRRDESTVEEVTVDIPASRDLAEGQIALYREFMVNLARVKSAADLFFRGGGSGDLPDAVLLIDEIGSGFEILGQARAAELCRRLRRFVSSTGFARLRGDESRAERFADAVAAIEYYIEACRSRLPTADGILDDLTRTVEALDSAAEPAEIAIEMPLAEEVTPESAQVAAALQTALPEVAETAPADAFDAGEDPEIREIFLEEAAEVLQTLQGSYAAWSRDPQDQNALTTLRRAFHTLKGSGRTVGATAIGEFGWALENMLNKCLDGSVTLSPGIVDTVSRALNVLPGLIEAFRARRAAPDDVAAVAAAAAEYAAGRTPAAATEPDLLEIFREDAIERLTGVDRWVDARAADGNVSVERGIVRDFHTIRGAARAIGANAIGEVANAVESYLEAAASAEMPLSPETRGTLREVAASLRAWVGELGTAAAAGQDAGPWLARIETLRRDVPAEAGGERQLAEIFAGEAFDLVAKIEAHVRGWAQAPDNRRAAAELKTLSHTLLGAAQMSSCQAIAEVARAMHGAFDGAAATSLVPAPDAIGTLLAACEGLFQYLDRFRDGRLASDESGWAARIDALNWRTTLPEVQAASATAPGRPAPAGGPEPTPELVGLEASGEPETVGTIELQEPAGETAEAIELPEAAEEILEMPPVEPGEPGELDAELLGIFQSEAEEILEGLDQTVTALERAPRNLAPLGEIKRLLHTLKGSANVTGLRTIGEVTHQLESLFERLEIGEIEAGTHFFARVQNALDGLNLALDDLKRGVIPDPVQLLDELTLPLVDERSSAAPAVPAEDAAAGGEAPPPGVTAPVPGAAPAPMPMPMPTPPRGVALPEDFDVELAQTFSAEAEELMELLEQALPRWQAIPGDYSPARDMLRALHTYKGGARMAGLMALGEAAHELESLIEGLEYAGDLDAGALRVVAGAVAELRHQTDRLQRGDYAPLIAPGGEPETEEAAEQQQQEVQEAQPAAAAGVAVDLTAVRIAEEAEVPALESPPAGMWHPLLFWRPEDEGDGLGQQRRETARVPVETLDRLLNEAGEISIYRSRMDEHNAAIQGQLEDMTQAIQRVRDQLRQLEIETEAQIAARGLLQTENVDRYAGEFDPLEMDRFTRMQELSRALNESVGDLAAVHGSIDQLASEETTILLQQGRITTEVQQGLMRTLMVPFSRQVARLQRVVQQTALENSKRVEIAFDGVEAELDRNVLERMTAPLEHLLRNAVIHGIEVPAERERNGKPTTGKLHLGLWREGSQLFIELADDGRGLDLQAIRETAIKRGLMPEDAEVSDDEAAQFIFMPGFSTARQLTHDAGRGVGMDVVAAEVKQLGGSLELASELGKGARFKIRLPLTLAMSQSLLVSVGHEQYAVPLPSVEGITRIPRDELDGYLADTGPELAYGGQHYRVRHLADLVGLPRETPTDVRTVHAILVRMPEGIGGEERRVAVVVDQLLGSREIVSKAVGPQISTIPGISGATILADGRVVLILDISELVQDRTRRVLRTQVAIEHGERAQPAEARRELVMVVDDSITIRRVTERLLHKHGFAVITAKDGLDAMAQLQTERPDAILLDIEMPRADGFEVATFVRNSDTIGKTPILMITSRSGEKHRERAAAIGVDRYLIKPYQEDQLLDELTTVLKERRT